MLCSPATHVHDWRIGMRYGSHLTEIEDEAGRCFAVVYTRAGCHGHRRDACGWANAQLIASIPQLLDIAWAILEIPHHTVEMDLRAEVWTSARNILAATSAAAPGPWRTAKEFDFSRDLIVAADGRGVAVVWTRRCTKPGAQTDRRYYEESAVGQANSRLIIMAPALRAAVEDLVASADDGDTLHPGVQAWNQAMNVIAGCRKRVA